MDKERLIEAYTVMRTIRRFEETLNDLYAENFIRGSIHLSIGQEAVAAGVGLAMAPQDKLTTTYRGHGHVIARKTPIRFLMAEMLGRETGINKGRGGSMHFTDVSRGVLGANAIVAAGIPHAVGAAYSAKYLKEDFVTVTIFGDGATNQGAFHEALNLAAVYQLPVLFVCENNLYSEMTPIEEIVPVDNMAERAEAYRIPSFIVDGYDVEEVYGAVKKSIEDIRSGKGPVFLEMKTYRLVGHMYGDQEIYRSREEVESWKVRDPLSTTADKLAAMGVDINGINASVERDIEDAVSFAKESAWPDPSRLYEGVYFGE
ncbi:thiamine pyrophosphate-dependent dehydrogenase E1 component subunit alpha [Paenibacillus abyssi]|uniref:Acetoin:2,6-dichlorophenolindophenol oxidoreductase subunit alpha n=1 Tax=Paenibacillus abyssi TaxID=1340531 RepID=A0A917D7I0_9BACL|nr:thiamine pyrophosphate-dependent dehydrogenase E1 component subunit alpha [Paenibacillus abyssi]GGG13578.1 acetoin:2,6-dichlorophenolindophenol oxidoreductase subunit alpha [Paenibacillus abyssi]